MQVNKFTFQNAIINVHFPDLTEETREQRKHAVQKTAAELLKFKEMEEMEQWEQAYKLH